MFYDNELNFLVDVLKKTHIPVTKVSLSAPIHTIIDIDFEKILGRSISKDVSIKEHLGTPDEGVMYKLSEPFGINYIYFYLPESDGEILFVGPYLSERATLKNLLEAGEQSGFMPKRQRLFELKLESIAIIPSDSPFLIMLDTFCEHIFNTKDLCVTEISKSQIPHPVSATITKSSDSLDEAAIKMEVLEKRYNYEKLQYFSLF